MNVQSVLTTVPRNSSAKPSSAAPGRLLLRKCACGGATGLSGECDSCQAQKLLPARSRSGPPVPEAPAIVYNVLQSTGQPLDHETRSFMEPRFGHDFSRVRVHTDTQAAESARAVGALAYTVGRDIVFGTGQYSPRTETGRGLLAHELTHVRQQSSGGIPNSPIRVSDPQDPHEREADEQSLRVISGYHSIATAVQKHGHGPILQRRVGDPTQRPPGLACPSAVDLPPPGIVDLFFDTEGVILSDAQKAQIDAFATSWQALGGGTPVRIDGFASTDGPEPHNWDLSCSRALAAMAELLAPASPGVPGIPSGNITIFAQGETDEFSTASLAPNRRAVISTPAPQPPAVDCSTVTPPPCPIGPPAPFLRDPHIPSGSLCRGACGADCPSTCTPLPDVTLCVTDATGKCHFTCTYISVIQCGSHLGCRIHDACYDACAAAGDPLGLCHRGCDIDCIDTFGLDCNSWRGGGGPFDRMLNFSNPPTISAAVTGPCPP
jgi:hypothetical protein